MASRTQLRNTSLHIRLTQILRDIVHRTVGETQAASHLQKIISDPKAPTTQLSSKEETKNENQINSSHEVVSQAEGQQTPQDAKSWQNYMGILKNSEKPQTKIVPKWKLEVASARVRELLCEVNILGIDAFVVLYVDDVYRTRNAIFEPHRVQ